MCKTIPLTGADNARHEISIISFPNPAAVQCTANETPSYTTGSVYGDSRVITIIIKSYIFIILYPYAHCDCGISTLENVARFIRYEIIFCRVFRVDGTTHSRQ